MKPSTLAWATCVILVLGQIIFFYVVVSPQLQSVNWIIKWVSK